MKRVRLDSRIENGSVVFTVSENTEEPLSQSQIKAKIEDLYQVRREINSWRTFDKNTVMQKTFWK